AQGMQWSARVEDVIIAETFLVAVEPDVDRRLANFQIAQRELRQPFRKMRINQQHVEWRIRIDAKHGLHHGKGGRRRPCLRITRIRIERREGMRLIRRMSAEHFLQAAKIKDAGWLNNGLAEPEQVVMEARAS